MKFSINYSLEEIEKTNELRFENKKIMPLIRKIKDMEVLYYNLPKNKIDLNTNAYYMFRNLFNEKIKRILDLHQLRFDLTLMENITIGNEFNKTHGHYHPEAAPGRSFPEIYQILKGKAMFILQNTEENIINDIILIEAEEDELIIIPPNYGHVMINVGNSKLITLNLVSSRFNPIYETYKKMKGAAYYLLTDYSLIKNKNYKINKKPRFFKVNKEKINLFEEIIKYPKKFRFLNRPYLLNNYFKFLIPISKELKMID